MGQNIKYFNPLFKNFTDKELKDSWNLKKRRLGMTHILNAMVIEMSNRAIFKKDNNGK